MLMLLPQITSQRCFLDLCHVSITLKRVAHHSWEAGGGSTSSRSQILSKCFQGQRYGQSMWPVISNCRLKERSQTAVMPTLVAAMCGIRQYVALVSGFFHSAQCFQVCPGCGVCPCFIPVCHMFSFPHCLSLKFLLISTYKSRLSLTFLGPENLGLLAPSSHFQALDTIVLRSS